MDAYVAELIGMLRKAFEIAWGITQERQPGKSDTMITKLLQ